MSLGGVNEGLLAAVPALTIHRRGRRSYEATARWILGADYDIIHWHWWERMPFMGMLAGQHRQPCVITCDVYPCRPEYRLSPAELAYGVLIVFDGRDAFDAYPDVSPARKEWIVGSARLDLYRPRNRPEFPGRLIFGRGSALTRLKCPARLIRDVAPIMRALPEAEFHIFGDGALAPTLQREIEKLGLAGRVQLRGWVPDFEEQVSGLDVYLYHLPWDSFGSSELNLQGAAAAGLPIVFVPSEGTRWMFDHGTEALVATDAVSAAVYAIELARDPARRERLGEAARAKANREWGVAIMADRYHDRVYGRLLTQSRGVQSPRPPSVQQSNLTTAALRIFRHLRRIRRRVRDRWPQC